MYNFTAFFSVMMLFVSLWTAVLQADEGATPAVSHQNLESTTSLAKHASTSPKRLYADPLGDVTYNPALYASITPTLVDRGADGRVSSRVLLCKSFSDSPCDVLRFNFSQLQLDPAEKHVMLDGKEIGDYRKHGGRITLYTAYRLRTETVSTQDNTPLHRGPRATLRLFIEQS